MRIGADPFYIASTTPGPDIDVTPVSGALHMFFYMGGGLYAGEASDLFSTTFSNGLRPASAGSVTFRGAGPFADSAVFTVVPEPSPLLLSVAALFALCLTARSRAR